MAYSERMRRNLLMGFYAVNLKNNFSPESKSLESLGKIIKISSDTVFRIKGNIHTIKQMYDNLFFSLKLTIPIW